VCHWAGGFGAAQDRPRSSGGVTEVDKTGKTIAIKTADGSEQVFGSPSTRIRTSVEAAKGAKMGAPTPISRARKERAWLHGKGADKTATMVRTSERTRSKPAKAP
jgi:hypothetical protein